MLISVPDDKLLACMIERHMRRALANMVRTCKKERHFKESGEGFFFLHILSATYYQKMHHNNEDTSWLLLFGSFGPNVESFCLGRLAVGDWATAFPFARKGFLRSFQ